MVYRHGIDAIDVNSPFFSFLFEISIYIYIYIPFQSYTIHTYTHPYDSKKNNAQNAIQMPATKKIIKVSISYPTFLPFLTFPLPPANQKPHKTITRIIKPPTPHFSPQTTVTPAPPPHYAHT